MEMARQIQLKRRSDIHWARKIWHFSGVMLIIVLYHNLSRPLALQLITFFACLFIAVDLLRKHIPSLNEVLLSIFHPVMRENEAKSTAGISYLLAGAFLVIYLFPKNIATIAFLFLAIADPLASYVGLQHGKDKLIGSKSLQGFIAAFIACSLISGIYFMTHNLMIDRLIIVTLISGLIGAFSELVPVLNLDDNLTFPLLSSIGLWFVFFLFGGF